MPIKPRIALSTGCSRTNERDYQAQLSYSYIYSVLRAGGAPCLLPPSDDPETLDIWLQSIDGLVIPGGPDLDPALYGESPHVMVEPVSGPRVGFDLRLCKMAFERGIPILGICHGCQVINISLGGTLHQDLLTAFPRSSVVHRRRISPFFVPHPVTVESGSFLKEIVGGVRIHTNSAHHQAVKDPGEGLRVVARADDGVVEALEWTADERFLLGIQWHPEKMAEKEEGPHRELFRALIQASRERVENGRSAAASP